MSTAVQTAQFKIATPTLPKAGSCLLVIFGGTGDLTKRKLIPALYDLACIGCTNPTFDVLGIGRTQLTDEQFQEKMHEGAAKSERRAQLQRETAGPTSPSGCTTLWAMPTIPISIPS